MDFMKLARERYSVRKFTKDPVNPNLLEKVLEAGNLAPTAGNRQPQRLLVLDNDKALAKIRDCTPFHFDAPAVVVASYATDACGKNRYNGESTGMQDVAIVLSHMMLAAVELGLGSTYVSVFDPEAVRREFNLPDNIKPVALLPIGVPDIEAKPHKHHYERKPLTKIVAYNNM